MKVSPLGVDTDLFFPAKTDVEIASRQELRSRFGFEHRDIVCVYSGRFTLDKKPLILARAIDRLYEMGEPFRGLFVGNGVQTEEILQCRGCTVHPFVRVTELPAYFRCADVGVWPTQESMSMLDAAACGLPIVVQRYIEGY